jgi:hypothetical protein
LISLTKLVLSALYGEQEGGRGRDEIYLAHNASFRRDSAKLTLLRMDMRIIWHPV